MYNAFEHQNKYKKKKSRKTTFDTGSIVDRWSRNACRIFFFFSIAYEFKDTKQTPRRLDWKTLMNDSDGKQT